MARITHRACLLLRHSPGQARGASALVFIAPTPDDHIDFCQSGARGMTAGSLQAESGSVCLLVISAFGRSSESGRPCTM
jgi:hypothetical protein